MKPDRGRTRAAATVESFVFTALLLFVTLGLLATTFDMSAAAAIVPRSVAVPLALLLSYVLVKETRLLMRQRASRAAEPTARKRDEISAILWLLALPASATVLGFVAGPALYVFGWMRLRAGERIGVAIGSAVFTALAILLLFSRLLGVHLPHGVLDYLR